VKKEGEILLGSPAIDISTYRRAYTIFKKLPEVYKKLYELENELKNLKESS
jgi:UDP-3-O-[3-hydroxymyristoyl] glucosamine N-acyltransferase